MVTEDRFVIYIIYQLMHNTTITTTTATAATAAAATTTTTTLRLHESSLCTRV